MEDTIASALMSDVYNKCCFVSPSGHPIGATGLGQCAEICWQLRGMADKRQVDGAKVGLQQNFGIGGAAVVTAYRAYTAPPAWAKL